MTQRHELEPYVRDWLHGTLDAIPDPIHRYPVVAAEVNQTPQQRSWLPRLPETGRFQTMFSATKFVFAGAVVALFGGFLLAGLLTQPSDERLPAVGASASATAQAEPTAAATAEPEPTGEAVADTTTLDPLPGVDLVFEEVESGVYRVLHDGVRVLTRMADPQSRGEPYRGAFASNIAAGLDGSVWWFGPDGFFRLGDEAGYDWPAPDVRPWRGTTSISVDSAHDFEVAPDGTLWRASGGLASFDGRGWTDRSQGQWESATGVQVQRDGTIWALWYNQNRKLRVSRLTADGWERIRHRAQERPSGLRSGWGTPELAVAPGSVGHAWPSLSA